MTDPSMPQHDIPTIELQSITMTFDRPGGGPPVRVLDDINLRLGAGRMVGIAGRSGSGKTTVLTIAAGLMEPRSGDVLWLGHPIGPIGTRERSIGDRREFVGVMAQDGALLPGLTATENAALSLVRSGIRRDDLARIQALFARLGLAGREHHVPSQLSGGEVQRVALARALAPEPAVLIVDEPTANLDRATADGIIAILAELRTEGRALLVASHDPRMLAAADEIFELEPDH
jgi:ABC-type lipoprotein export system ATPase subunit